MPLCVLCDIAAELQLQGILIEGQMASDKKPSRGNVKEPRGVQVIVWRMILNEICKEVLGCSTKRLYDVQTIIKEGGIRNGQFGCNINTANIVSAMFIACGQDAASVAEGCWSHLTSEYDHTTEELKMSVFFPSLPVGVVGGGTNYVPQKQGHSLWLWMQVRVLQLPTTPLRRAINVLLEDRILIEHQSFSNKKGKKICCRLTPNQCLCKTRFQY